MLHAATMTSTNKTLLRRRLISPRGSSGRAIWVWRCGRLWRCGRVCPPDGSPWARDDAVDAAGRLRCGADVHGGLTMQMLTGTTGGGGTLQR